MWHEACGRLIPAARTPVDRRAVQSEWNVAGRAARRTATPARRPVVAPPVRATHDPAGDHGLGVRVAHEGLGLPAPAARFSR